MAAVRTSGRLLLLLAVALPGASEGRTVLDPQYAVRRTAQREEVPRRIRRLVSPTLAFPELVRYGGRFPVLLRPSRSPDGKPFAGAVAAWTVHLQPGGKGSAFRCAVRTLRLVDRMVRLEVEVPVELARDVYDLRVMGPGVDEIQPNAVRVLGARAPSRFRFAVVTDHQLWDPSYRLSGKEINAGAYPRATKEDAALAIARQGFAELALHDPDFVVDLGDLVFGINYPREYEEAYALLRSVPLAIFAVVGNHDGYADYVVRLRGGALSLLAGAVGCRRHLEGELGWGKAWVFITCVYGDVKDLLYADLHRDGLAYWQRQLAPPAYAFDHGQLHFVAINTYDGTPERRHAFSIYMDAFDLRLGVPAVDNYGGYVSDEQLSFVRREAQLAERRGQTLVILGHHDPRGNADGQRYHPNEPFPTDPLSLGGFKEWNYDDRWDSNPKDRRGAESAARNSGTALLEILARHGGYYLSGHVHHDARTVFDAGSTLSGFPVRRRLEFIRTTTASSSAKENGYSGYRLLEVEGARITGVEYAPERGLGSVPAGNLWVESTSPPGSPHGSGLQLALSTGLPRPTTALVRWALPALPEGYRFRLGSATDRGGVASTEGKPAVREVMFADGQIRYQIEVELPAASYPPTQQALVRRVLRAAAARGNQPPRGVIDVSAAGARPSAGADAVVGQPLLLSAERTADPQRDSVVLHLWDLGDGHSARGPRVTHTFVGPGPRTIRLTVVDEAGAQATVSRVIAIRHRPPPGCGGCAPAPVGPVVAGAAGAALLALVSVAGVWWRRRRK